MKAPFQFPNWGEWTVEIAKTNKCSVWDEDRAYALFYLLALKDWVNEGWEPVFPGRVYNLYFSPGSEQWNIGNTRHMKSQLFYFATKEETWAFLNHKSETTNTIEQLNILYSIDQ